MMEIRPPPPPPPPLPRGVCSCSLDLLAGEGAVMPDDRLVIVLSIGDCTKYLMMVMKSRGAIKQWMEQNFRRHHHHHHRRQIVVVVAIVDRR